MKEQLVKSEELRWFLASFKSCFYQLIPFGLPYVHFGCCFSCAASLPLISSLTRPLLLPTLQSLLWAHHPNDLSKTWSWSGHFLFKIIQRLPIAYRMMPTLPGMTFRGCHDLESLNFLSQILYMPYMSTATPNSSHGSLECKLCDSKGLSLDYCCVPGLCHILGAQEIIVG